MIALTWNCVALKRKLTRPAASLFSFGITYGRNFGAANIRLSRGVGFPPQFCESRCRSSSNQPSVLDAWPMTPVPVDLARGIKLSRVPIQRRTDHRQTRLISAASRAGNGRSARTARLVMKGGVNKHKTVVLWFLPFGVGMLHVAN